MISFKKFLLENLGGEYWIDDNGQVIGADGDVSDTNHEGYVIDILRNQIVEQLGYYSKFGRSEYIDWDAFVSFLEEEGLLDQAIAKIGEEWEIANGTGDARYYAIKTFNWKIYRDGNIETMYLTKDDIDTIATGIYEIIGHEPEGEEFSIYIYSSDKSITVTWEELNTGNISPQMDNKVDMHRQTYQNITNQNITPNIPKGSEKVVKNEPYTDFRRKYLNNFGENIS